MALAPSPHSRKLGSLLGLIVGDALGATNEFLEMGAFPPVTDMVGGGPFSLPPGAWTDDTLMALCLAESLVEMGRFDPADQMERYLRWREQGYLSSIGRCFDIGVTTHRALVRFKRTGDPLAGSTDPHSAGNGSVMRLAPVVVWAADDVERALRLARESSRTTHRAAESVDGCELLARLLLGAFRGEDVTVPMDNVVPSWSPGLREVAAMAGAPGLRPPREPTGYVVDTLSCARWCAAGGKTFSEAVLRAANLGGDSDTIAAVTGQIAGAMHGVEGIPTKWIERLAHRKRIMELSEGVVRGPVMPGVRRMA
jgi:ADP-ribosyl-[dinitrogen reductase] hydrolase